MVDHLLKEKKEPHGTGDQALELTQNGREKLTAAEMTT